MKDKEFLNFMFTKSSDLGFVHAKQSVKVTEMIDWLKSKQDWADKNNKGFISWDVLTTKADANKFYSTWNDYLKPGDDSGEVSAGNHMPDRGAKVDDLESDLPF